MAGIGAKVRDWFNGGDPQGHIKIRQWLRGYDDRPEGWTYGMMGPVMGLTILAAILYPLDQDLAQRAGRVGAGADREE